jgi:type I restriction-modification system DNA methylase subunit
MRADRARRYMSTNTSQLAAYIWSLADLLRGDFKQLQYGRVILPFTILRRLECVLEQTKAKVLKEAENQMNQVLSSKNVAADFGRIVFDLLVAQMKAGQIDRGPPSSQRR